MITEIERNMMTQFAAALSAILFLFFYGTGQAFCLCEPSDNCAGFANEFSLISSTTIEQCCSDMQPNIKSTDDCCAKCPTTESSVSSLRQCNFSDEHLQKLSLTHSPSTQVLGSITQSSSAQRVRPPPEARNYVSEPIYIIYRSLLI